MGDTQWRPNTEYVHSSKTRYPIPKHMGIRIDGTFVFRLELPVVSEQVIPSDYVNRCHIAR